MSKHETGGQIIDLMAALKESLARPTEAATTHPSTPAEAPREPDAIAVLRRRRDTLRTIAGDDPDASPVIVQMQEEVAALTAALDILESHAARRESTNDGAAFIDGIAYAFETGMYRDLEPVETASRLRQIAADFSRVAELEARATKAEQRLAKLADEASCYGAFYIKLDAADDEDPPTAYRARLAAGVWSKWCRTQADALNAAVDALPEPSEGGAR